jgi:FkbM family methyltransferase
MLIAPFLRYKMKTLLRNLTHPFSDFRPYITTFSIKGHGVRFFIGTPEAAAWYDPLKPHTKLECEWIVTHLPLEKEKIIDGGAHHGLYATVFALGSRNTSQVVAVDPVPSNCDLTRVNLALNGVEARVEQCAISNADGYVPFAFETCGRIVPRSQDRKPARRLQAILPDATVIKLDIEGSEFHILPAQIDDMPDTHTWIVEIHPRTGKDPHSLVRSFENRGFDIWWFNRRTNHVEPYPAEASWETRTSIIARRSWTTR